MSYVSAHLIPLASFRVTPQTPTLPGRLGCGVPDPGTHGGVIKVATAVDAHVFLKHKVDPGPLLLKSLPWLPSVPRRKSSLLSLGYKALLPLRASFLIIPYVLPAVSLAHHDLVDPQAFAHAAPSFWQVLSPAILILCLITPPYSSGSGSGILFSRKPSLPQPGSGTPPHSAYPRSLL